MKSLPDYCWHKRLNDNAASWSNGTNTRFASTNECDFILFDCNSRTLNAVELKSTKSTLTFWKSDFDQNESKYKKHYNIKKNQILGLEKWKSNYPINCGFVFNFRNENNDTFYVGVDDFLDYTDKLKKKSIGINDVLNMNPIKIENYKLRTNYRYDIDGLLKKIRLA